MTEDEMVGWHHQLEGHEFEQTSGVGDGQGSLASCTPWGCKESDMTEWLNWTEATKKPSPDVWWPILWSEHCGWYQMKAGKRSAKYLGTIYIYILLKIRSFSSPVGYYYNFFLIWNLGSCDNPNVVKIDKWLISQNAFS